MRGAARIGPLPSGICLPRMNQGTTTTRARRPGGYAASAAGTVAGAVSAAALGAFVGWQLAEPLFPGGELEQLIPFVVGLSAGFWAGAALGCWAALRWGDHPAPGRTAAILAAVVPLVVAVLLLAGLSLWIALLVAMLAGGPLARAITPVAAAPAPPPA